MNESEKKLRVAMEFIRDIISDEKIDPLSKLRSIETWVNDTLKHPEKDLANK